MVLFVSYSIVTPSGVYTYRITMKYGNEKKKFKRFTRMEHFNGVQIHEIFKTLTASLGVQ